VARTSGGGGRRLHAIDELTGIRGVGVSLVVLYHGSQSYHHGVLVGAWMAVDVFFVLSGFLITALLVNEWDARGRISLPRFYARRALRLLPALIVFLAVVLATLPAVPRPVWHNVVEAVAAAFFYFANFWVALRGVHSAIAHTWSLSMEEQFYAVWPVALLIALRLRASRRAVAIGALAGAGAIALARAICEVEGGGWIFLFFGPLHADGLLVGCALGVLWASDLLPRGQTWSHALVAIGVASVGFLAWITWTVRPDVRWLFQYGFFLVALASAGLVLAAADAPRWFVAPLRLPPVVFMGRISYALYLWHGFLFISSQYLHWMPIWLAAVVSVVAAILSHYLVERPFLRLKRRVAPTRTLADVVVEPAPS
jgi:peptidoglycan/LPS O-acetylase OafA/YrhL